MPRNKKLETIEDELDLSDIFGKQESPIEAIIDEDVLDNPNIQPVTEAPKKRAIESFNTPIYAEEEVTIPSTKKRFIRKEIIIDKFNTVRRRVELTPSMCDTCAFDVAEKAGGWYNIPADQKDIVRKALAKHKEVVHTKSDYHIIDEDEVPTKWLGGGKL